MGALSDLRHKAQGEILEVLTKLPYGDFTKPLAVTRKKLAGKSGLTPEQIVSLLTNALETVQLTKTQAATLEAWTEVALLRQAQIEEEIEAHHAALDRLNEELEKLESGTIYTTQQEVIDHLENIEDTLAQAKTVAELRVKGSGASEIPSDEEDIA